MTIDLSPFVDVFASLASVALTAAVGILVPAILKRLGISNDAALVGKLTAAADAAIGEGYRQAVIHGHDLTIPAGQNAAIAIAANYLLGKLPDTVKQLGLTPEHVQDMVSARLGKLLAADPTLTTQRALPAPEPAAPATPENHTP